MGTFLCHLPTFLWEPNTSHWSIYWGFLSPSQNLKFADVPSGIAAISKVPLEGWLQARDESIESMDRLAGFEDEGRKGW